MNRITISIPDKLMARLEPIKPEINISRFCREALEHRVEDFEKLARRDALDVDILVKRLRDERSADESKFEDLGKDDAERWLDTVSYFELKNIVENPNSSNMSKYKLPRVAFEVMKQSMSEANVSCEGGQAVAYKTAWLDYVRSVWARVPVQTEEPNQTRTVEDQLEEAVESGAREEILN